MKTPSIKDLKDIKDAKDNKDKKRRAEIDAFLSLQSLQSFMSLRQEPSRACLRPAASATEIRRTLPSSGAIAGWHPDAGEPGQITMD